MMESLDFVYDEILSRDMGLINVTMDSGLYKESFLADREIVEATTSRKDEPDFQQIKRSPLSFSFTFAFEDGWDNDKLSIVKRWLDVDYYKPFWFENDPDRIYYCMLDNSSELNHNGNKEGYITLTMRCNSPFSFTPIVQTGTYDCSIAIPVIQDDFVSGTFEGDGLSTAVGDLKLKRLTWGDLKTKKWGDLL